MPSLVHTVKSQGGFFYVVNDGTYCRARQKIKHEDGHSFFAPSHWPMVPTEIWSCTLAYNLIRLKILQTCVLTEHAPRTTSFTSTMQLLATKWLLDTHDVDWGKVNPEFGGSCKPDADAIAQMTIENYTTMRSTVTDPKYGLKSQEGDRFQTGAAGDCLSCLFRTNQW